MADRGLKILLWIAAVGWGSSIFMVVAPWSCYETCADMLGFGALPTGPAVLYGVRVMSAVSAFVGAYLLILATNPRAYVPFLNLGIGGLMFIGLVCLVAGVMSNMHLLWYLGDGLGCWVIGSLLFIWRLRPETVALTPTQTS